MVFTKGPLPTKVPQLEIVLASGHLVRVPAGADSDRLQAYLQEQQAAALLKSPLDAAIGCAPRNWVALRRYTGDGRFKIDNNGTERALRPIVLGRTGCSPGAKRRRTAPPSCVRWFRSASTCGSIRSSIYATRSSASPSIPRGWSWN